AWSSGHHVPNDVALRLDQAALGGGKASAPRVRLDADDRLQMVRVHVLEFAAAVGAPAAELLAQGLPLLLRAAPLFVGEKIETHAALLSTAAMARSISSASRCSRSARACRASGERSVLV